MKIIGRKREKDSLMQSILSKRPEFVVVYGRRRVGKTYLIREYFNNQFSFYATGLSDEKTKGQLRAYSFLCTRVYKYQWEFWLTVLDQIIF